jgi:hypothetical protein
MKNHPANKGIAAVQTAKGNDLRGEADQTIEGNGTRQLLPAIVGSRGVMKREANGQATR